LLIVGNDGGGFAEEAIAGGGFGAAGLEDGIADGLEFGLLGGR